VVTAAALHQTLVGRPLRADEGLPRGAAQLVIDQARAAAALRARLGDAAWAAGQAMSLDQAVAYALEDAPDAA
jgi:hypothetical protein